MVSESRLGDRYELRDRIASGGMGSVHLGHDHRLDRTVAIKLLKEGLAEDPRFIERFKREARAAAGLSHPNIAGIFDYGQDGGRHFIVMEYAEGRDLSKVLRDEGALGPERARKIALQIATALGYAHSYGLVHRDVKPANVIVGDEDTVKVTDFGIARAVGDSTLTATGSVLGTAQYLSPEQAAGGEVGSGSDVYSLGIVLYEMLTGTVPFTADSALAVALRHVGETVPAPSELNPGVPADLDEIVLTATAKDPGQRFPGGAQMAAALEGAPTAPLGAGAGATMFDGSRTPPPEGWSLARPARVLLMAAGALALLAIVLAGARVITAEDRPQAGDRTQEQEQQPSAQGQETSPEAVFVVPANVVGLKYEDVAGAVEASGLQIELIRTAVDDAREEGTIVASDPGGGSEVEAGGTITLSVSTGEVPDEDDDDDEDDDEDDHPGRGRGRGKGRGKGDD